MQRSAPRNEQEAVAKLSTPRFTQILRRPRVLKAIEEASQTGMCWLAAPAGFGKTTALIDYLETFDAPHVWFRIDDGDQDIARFFHYLALSLGSAAATAAMPVFATEYAEHPREFARLFFRAYFARLKPGTLVVLDDLHYASSPEFSAMLLVMLSELPRTLRCVCISRTLPPEELSDLVVRGQLSLIDRAQLEFSEAEARDLVKMRLKQEARSIDVSAAGGWAVGLVLLSTRGAAMRTPPGDGLADDQQELLDTLGRYLFFTLPAADQDMLLRLNLLPEITSELADAMIGSADAGRLLERLYQRQLLITRVASKRNVFQLHDLLRQFLDRQLEQSLSDEQQAKLREKAATVLIEAGRGEEAIPLALQATAWPLARDLILDRAETVLAQGRRATFIDWCAKLPAAEMTGWLCYWLGAAHMPDDAMAERYLARAMESFEADRDLRGQCLTVSRAVLVKTDSWRTYEGLSVWTQRALKLLARGLPELDGEEGLLVRIGMLRALNFADDYYRSSEAGLHLETELLDRLAQNLHGDPSSLRLMASESLIEHSVSTGKPDVFAKAVDSVTDDLRNSLVPPWILGMWLVAFGSKSGRYFPYSRRGFSYLSAEAALRAAIEIGERESFKSVEFGGLYHLQMQMKFRNDFAEFGQIVARLADIADSRFTTQVAVVADCYAAVHSRQGAFLEAYRDCDTFMAAIEAANEPMVERWPHYITKFQVYLADRKPEEAIALLAELLPKLDGGARRRTELCILAAAALRAKWGGASDYGEHLRRFLAELRDANWPMILLSLPELLAELLGDALDRCIEADYCRAIIASRRLAPPESRPAHWPWPLKIYLLGGFRLERDGGALDVGSKPPTRALDILRALAISKNKRCSMESLQDWLWPDLDGDQAKAACEQALHRLRKLLGQTDLVIQREGKLRLAVDKVWVDLADWESRLNLALASDASGSAVQPELKQLFLNFPGPLLFQERASPWSQPVAERVRRSLIDLAINVGRLSETGKDHRAAREVYLRALEFYPDSATIHKALIQGAIAQNDTVAALEDYSRYERTLRASGEDAPSSEIRALIEPHLARPARSEPRAAE